MLEAKDLKLYLKALAGIRYTDWHRLKEMIDSAFKAQKDEAERSLYLMASAEQLIAADVLKKRTEDITEATTALQMKA
ncbi:MAG: hypothetical protein ACOX63_10230 [Christensenellales bacterium]